MQLDLFFNELCTHDRIASIAMAREAVEQFARTLRRARSDRRKVSLTGLRDYLHQPLCDGLSFAQWLKEPGAQRDLATMVKTLIAQRSPVAPAPVETDAWCCGDVPCDGLKRAFFGEGVSISLLTAPRWNEALVEIRRMTTDGNLSVSAPESCAAVRHMASEEHFGVHEAWLEAREGKLGAFRKAAERSGIRHVPASEYSGGKHVKGGSNADRQRFAGSGGNGQFLARDEDGSVGDARITEWERAAIDQALVGESVKVEQHAENTFYLFWHCAEQVGFRGGTGEPTNQLRVEWSSGNVHSHPC